MMEMSSCQLNRVAEHFFQNEFSFLEEQFGERYPFLFTEFMPHLSSTAQTGYSPIKWK